MHKNWNIMEVITPELSIIIVNYKNQELILQCVQSLAKYLIADTIEILVIDNNSNDNSEMLLRQIYPKLIWCQMGYNSGFSRANNKGIKLAKGQIIVLLNSDIILKGADTISECIRFYKSLPAFKKTILGVRLINSDGTYQETLRLNFPGIMKEVRANALFILIINRIIGLYSKKKQKQKETHYKSGSVAWINGAFLMMQRENIIKYNLLFDEDFFLYGEDMEFAWRANELGFEYYHWSKQELTHIGSASMPNDLLKRSQIIVSDWLYIKKTRGKIYLVLLLFMVFCNLLIDDLIFLLAQIRTKKIDQYAITEGAFRPIYKYLLKKYGLRILFRKNLSSVKDFYTNCYEDTFLNNQ
jgi:GT2 family glycosyltransferase